MFWTEILNFIIKEWPEKIRKLKNLEYCLSRSCWAEKVKFNMLFKLSGLRDWKFKMFHSSFNYMKKKSFVKIFKDFRKIFYCRHDINLYHFDYVYSIAAILIFVRWITCKTIKVIHNGARNMITLGYRFTYIDSHIFAQFVLLSIWASENNDLKKC